MIRDLHYDWVTEINRRQKNLRWSEFDVTGP